MQWVAAGERKKRPAAEDPLPAAAVWVYGLGKEKVAASHFFLVIRVI